MNEFAPWANEPALLRQIFHPVHGIWLYLLAAAVLLALAVHTWRYRQAAPARFLVLGAATRVLWLVALVMISISPALADKLLWAVIHQLGALAILPVALMTALHLTGQRPTLIRTCRAFLFAITGLFWLAVLTSRWHGWYWSGILWDGATFGLVRGPLYLAAFAVTYLTFAITLAIYARQAATTSGLRRWQALAIPADMLLSMAGHYRWVTSSQTDPIPVLPLAFMLGGLVWFVIFFRLRVFNLQELAESTVTRDMRDCLIVLDAQGHVAELNPAAAELLGKDAAAMPGRKAPAAFAPWPDLAALAESPEPRTGEIVVAGGSYLFRVTPLTGWRGKDLGRAIVLQDIHELKKAQARILEQEKALSILAERDRLGRELHDGPGQVWSFLGLKLQAIGAILAGGHPQQAEQEVGRLLGTVKRMHADARESIVGLKLAGSAGHGFIAKLEDYLAWYRESTGIHVELSLSPDWEEDAISRLWEVQMLRIVQEALTNVRKHAGAGRVRIGIEAAGGQVLVLVEDDGCGFDAAALAANNSSYGLRIMAERAAEAGGRMEAVSKIGAGTTVTVRFGPENAEDKAEHHENIAGR